MSKKIVDIFLKQNLPSSRDLDTFMLLKRFDMPLMGASSQRFESSWRSIKLKIIENLPKKRLPCSFSQVRTVNFLVHLYFLKKAAR